MSLKQIYQSFPHLMNALATRMLLRSRLVCFLLLAPFLFVPVTLCGCSDDAQENGEETNNGLPEAEVVAEYLFIVRVTGKGEDVRLELPLPLESDRVQVLNEEFRLRGFEMEEALLGDHRLAILTHPKLEGRRRITYKALLAIDSIEHSIPSISPPISVPSELNRYTLPTPRIQSRSPLVRERLIEHVAPRLEEGSVDLTRAIFLLVTGHFERRRAGSTNNVLRAIREGHANDLGLDRLLVTFMRNAGIPARNVTGFRLRTDGGRKLERWTEIYVGNRWVPMSAPNGWYGELPADYLPLSYGERTLIEREGVSRLTFKVLVRDPRPSILENETYRNSNLH